MRKSLLAATLAAAVTAANGQAPDPNFARDISAACANCHGTRGVSQGVIPSLAGQPKAELARKLQDYKAGRLAGTVMPQLAKGYSDQEIEQMAGWFAAQKP